MDSDSLILGLKRGYVDQNIPANAEDIPKFITNNPSRGEKVITSIREEMRSCESFMFSVAFITYDGINALLQEFRYLRDHNIRGRILTSQYQNFTEPRALETILSLGNIELKIVTSEYVKMHTKCYIFSKKGTYDIIIGSSNLTNNALCSNGEWNVRFNSLSTGELVKDIIDEFEKDYACATPITPSWIREYEKIYQIQGWKNRFTPEDTLVKNDIVPNEMQKNALEGLQRIRDSGETRALIISATGSGKTYLSAFDAKIYNKRYLYLVHRRPILNKSFKSFKNVLGPNVKMEKFDNSDKLSDAQFVFATMQTMSKKEVYENIPKDRFDYIMIDEAHHIGAESYRRIVSYFQPEFLAGMTATPDRTDGFDIYKFFHYQIAYEIRLKQAMELNLTCPFHYFGISDLTLNGEYADEFSEFTKIEFEKKVDYIIENAKFYGYGGDRLRGLVFCSSIKDAKRYADAFSRHGYRTAWVSGNLRKKDIESHIVRLESDGKYALDYIFAVDLFNEGVDIPSVNQLILLRPTESAIVYIQQLGRGLRMADKKDFVTVIDFIGNYDKNYNIPVALSDDNSYNKDKMRRFVHTGDSVIYGNSTISFDEISKSKIYESIDKTSFSQSKFILENYKNLKNKLGRIPKLMDFIEHGSIDVSVLLSKYGSYHNFLAKYEKDYRTKFSNSEEKVLEYITKIIAPGKRYLEIDVLKILMNSNRPHLRNTIAKLHPDLYSIALDNIISVFDGTFYTNEIRLVANDAISDTFSKMLDNNDFTNAVYEIIDVGSKKNFEYQPTYRNTNFVLNKMYTYNDVCRLMNWSKNINAINIGGYKFDTKSNTFSIFINYVKGKDVAESINYPDHFENRSTLIAVSKSTEDKNSKNMVRVRDHKINGMTIHLFVRKNKEDEGSKEFYYLGELEFVSFMDNNKPVKIQYKLKDELRTDLFDYFNS